jgi:uncharacterized protein
MIVVADASPLNYLIQIECQNVLSALYGSVLIPKSVLQELSDPGAPPAVARWAVNLPLWIEVRGVTNVIDIKLLSLDPGERDAHIAGSCGKRRSEQRLNLK